MFKDTQTWSQGPCTARWKARVQCSVVWLSKHWRSSTFPLKEKQGNHLFSQNIQSNYATLIMIPGIKPPNTPWPSVKTTEGTPNSHAWLMLDFHYVHLHLNTELNPSHKASQNSSRTNRHWHFIYFFDVRMSFVCRYLFCCHVMTAEQQQIVISSALINLLPNEYSI